MRRAAAVLLAAAFLLAAGPCRAAGGNVTVLIYHRFADSRYPSTSVGLDRFREQMAWLAGNGYRVIPLSRLAGILAAGGDVPERAAVITIDDAYASVYEHAWPVLREFGFPFSLFVYVRAVDRGYGDFMSWREIGEMAAAGAEIGSHGYAHARLTEPPDGVSGGAYRRWIAADIEKSRRVIRDRLGFAPRFYAIPYGAYNDVVLEVAAGAGFDAVLTQDPGSVSSATSRFMIPREPILGRDWSTIGHFAAVVRRRDLPLSEWSPRPGPVSAPLRFEAAVVEPGRYRGRDFEIYISELGWNRMSREHGRLRFDFPGPFTRRFNRVVIRGRLRDGGVAVRSWLIGPAAERRPRPVTARSR